jgi:hypothetical protein
LARWCPACRRRESGLRLPYGTGEGMPRYCAAVLAGEREHPKWRIPRGVQVPMRGVLTDRLVVVMKPL